MGTIDGSTRIYLPITLNNAGAADNYSINLFENVTENGLSGGTQVIDYADYVKYTWRALEDIAGGSNLTVSLQWNAADEGTGFTRASCGMGYHDGTYWRGVAPGVAGGGPPYFLSRAGISGVGSFAIGKSCTAAGDGTTPTIVCPPSVFTAKTSDDGNGDCATTVVTGAPTPGDNCGLAGLVITAEVGIDAINPATYKFPVGATIIFWYRKRPRRKNCFMQPNDYSYRR